MRGGRGITAPQRNLPKPCRPFLLYRGEDVSGVSGTGYIAEGIEFHDKQCVLSWFGKYHALGIYPSAKQLLKVHGHEGRTIIIWT